MFIWLSPHLYIYKQMFINESINNYREGVKKSTFLRTCPEISEPTSIFADIWWKSGCYFGLFSPRFSALYAGIADGLGQEGDHLGAKVFIMYFSLSVDIYFLDTVQKMLSIKKRNFYKKYYHRLIIQQLPGTLHHINPRSPKKSETSAKNVILE